MKLKKSDYKLLIICICLVIISLIIYSFQNPSNEKKVNVNNEEKISLVTDYSRFFTVNSCISKYMQYLQSDDKDSLLKVLNEKYISDNKITKSNIYTFLPNFNDTTYSFVSKKMYYETLQEGIYKFYVLGNLYIDTIESSQFERNEYFVLELDTNNQIFNIAPYNGKYFK